MATISRDTYLESNLYQKVIAQIGKVVIDNEWNELQDIIRVMSRRQIYHGFCNFASVSTGMKVVENVGDNVNKVKITAGISFVHGCYIYLSADYVLTCTNPGAGTDYVYMKLQEVEITGAADPNLINPVWGEETTRRTQLQVTYVYNNTPLSSDAADLHEGGVKYYRLAIISRTGPDAIPAAEIADDRECFQSNQEIRQLGLKLGGFMDTGRPWWNIYPNTNKDLSILRYYGTDYGTGYYVASLKADHAAQLHGLELTANEGPTGVGTEFNVGDIVFINFGENEAGKENFRIEAEQISGAADTYIKFTIIASKSNTPSVAQDILKFARYGAGDDHYLFNFFDHNFEASGGAVLLQLGDKAFGWNLSQRYGGPGGFKRFYLRKGDYENASAKDAIEVRFRDILGDSRCNEVGSGATMILGGYINGTGTALAETEKCAVVFGDFNPTIQRNVGMIGQRTGDNRELHLVVSDQAANGPYIRLLHDPVAGDKWIDLAGGDVTVTDTLRVGTGTDPTVDGSFSCERLSVGVPTEPGTDGHAAIDKCLLVGNPTAPTAEGSFACERLNVGTGAEPGTDGQGRVSDHMYVGGYVDSIGANKAEAIVRAAAGKNMYLESGGATDDTYARGQDLYLEARRAVGDKPVYIGSGFYGDVCTKIYSDNIGNDYRYKNTRQLYRDISAGEFCHNATDSLTADSFANPGYVARHNSGVAETRYGFLDLGCILPHNCVVNYIEFRCQTSVANQATFQVFLIKTAIAFNGATSDCTHLLTTPVTLAAQTPTVVTPKRYYDTCSVSIEYHDETDWSPPLSTNAAYTNYTYYLELKLTTLDTGVDAWFSSIMIGFTLDRVWDHRAT